jgi:hypothetical protein
MDKNVYIKWRNEILIYYICVIGNNRITIGIYSRQICRDKIGSAKQITWVERARIFAPQILTRNLDLSYFKILQALNV